MDEMTLKQAQSIVSSHRVKMRHEKMTPLERKRKRTFNGGVIVDDADEILAGLFGTRVVALGVNKDINPIL
jgi:hypothetical protein